MAIGGWPHHVHRKRQSSRGGATGIIALDGENVEFYLTCTMGSEIFLYRLDKISDGLHAEDQYEYWVCDYKSKRKFIATVRETTFFQPGEQIVFYRVEP